MAEHLEREGLDHPNCRCVYNPLDHGPFAGIDRGVAPERLSGSFIGGGGPLLTVELLREGMAKLLEHDARHPGPKPLIRRALAEYLLRAGCTRDQLDAFEIIE